MMDQKNLLLAIVLSVGIMLGFQWYGGPASLARRRRNPGRSKHKTPPTRPRRR